MSGFVQFVWVGWVALTASIAVAADPVTGVSPRSVVEAGKPVPNPFLAAPLYAIRHFDSSASDAFPYGPPRGEFEIDLSK